MATLRLKVSDKILDKVLWLLGQFKSEDLQIMETEQAFEENKNYLENELARTNSTETKFYSIDEFDALMEKTISEHED
jgi:hypothetical protein